jgi:hypothetical protein
VIKRTAEPKFIHWDIGAASEAYGPSTLAHNSFNQWTIYSVASSSTNLNLFPHVGDGRADRNGNEIYGKGFMLRGSFNFAGDRRGTTLRFYLIAPSQVTEGPTYDKVFENITNNVELDPLDKANFPSTKYLGSYKIPDRSAPTAGIDGTYELIDSNLIFKKWIPFARKIKFKASNSNEPTNIPPYMQLAVTAYDHNSALETDTCVKNIDLVASFYYSDP